MIRKLIPLFLFGGIHLMFLFFVLSKAHNIFYGIGLVPLIGYLCFELKPLKFNLKEYLVTLISFGIGFILTFQAASFFSVTPIYASALVGIIFSFFFKKSVPLFPAIVYSGSFAGMVSDFHIIDTSIAFLIILTGGNLFYFLRDNFNGLGGKLGSIGFGAMLVPVLLGGEESFFTKVYYEATNIDPIGELSSNKTLLFTIIISILGTITTYWLNNKKGFGPINSSAIPSLIIAIPLQLFPISGFIALIPVIFFGATFVGMTNEKTLSWLYVLISSVFYACAFHFIHHYFNGYGGALGATACLCCLIGLLLQKTFNRQTVRI